MPSWCEWMSVSSRSSTRIFRRTTTAMPLYLFHFRTHETCVPTGKKAETSVREKILRAVAISSAFTPTVCADSREMKGKQARRRVTQSVCCQGRQRDVLVLHDLVFGVLKLLELDFFQIQRSCFRVFLQSCSLSRPSLMQIRHFALLTSGYRLCFCSRPSEAATVTSSPLQTPETLDFCNEFTFSAVAPQSCTLLTIR